MKISFNPLMKGKPSKEEVPALESQNAWTSIELEPEDAFELITVDGYATTCDLASGIRKEHNYSTKQLFMIDIDDGMRIEQLLEDEFYNRYGAGFYTSSSHTDELHKFRILFLTPQPVIGAYQARKIARGLRLIYPMSDRACIDPARLFYGSVDCPIKEWQGKVIDQEVIDLLVEQIDQEDQARELSIQKTSQDKPVKIEDVKRHLDQLVKYYPRLEYSLRRDITWAVLSGCSGSDTIELMRSRWSDLESTVKYEKFVADFSPSRGLNVGTIVHYIRQYDATYYKNPAKLSVKQLKDKLSNLEKING